MTNRSDSLPQGSGCTCLRGPRRISLFFRTFCVQKLTQYTSLMVILSQSNRQIRNPFSLSLSHTHSLTLSLSLPLSLWDSSKWDNKKRACAVQCYVRISTLGRREWGRWDHRDLERHIVRDSIATHGMWWYIPPFGFVSLFRLSATATVMVGRRGGHISFCAQSSGQRLDWLDESTQSVTTKACVCSTMLWLY